MSRFTDIIVIAIDHTDFEQWIVENPELSGGGVDAVLVGAEGWEAVAPSRIQRAAITYIMTEQAAQAPRIGGTELPRWLRIADALAENRRPRYLKAVA